MIVEQQAVVSQERLAQWIEHDYDCVRPRSGDVQEGMIASISEEEIIVHLEEAKRDGSVSASDLKSLDDEFRAALKVGDKDLLDAAAVQTVAKAGTVYVLDLENVPDQAPLAAVLRISAMRVIWTELCDKTRLVDEERYHDYAQDEDTLGNCKTIQDHRLGQAAAAETTPQPQAPYEMEARSPWLRQRHVRGQSRLQARSAHPRPAQTEEIENSKTTA